MGVLTAGGDCPGLNAVVRATVVRAIERHDAEVVGILNGWEGLMEGRTRPLDRDDVRGILARGGTILGTSRLDPYVHGDGFESVRKTLESNDMDALVVIGGDGTLRTAMQLYEDGGLPVVGVPKTIDNDIDATDVTFGFDTAVQIATEAIDRIATTAEAHNRVMLVEVMGRTKGWIAAYSGIAAGADAIIIPEVDYDLDTIAKIIRKRHRRGHTYSVVVIAEGVEPPAGLEVEERIDQFGFKRLGGVAYTVGHEIERLTGFETRVTVLGHLQRGGTPSATDRVLATRFGVKAADLAAEGTFGTMVALRGTEMVAVPIADACATIRGVPDQIYDVAETFFG
ncbi:MAG: 6-phosphofructokinase [Acidimicrobiia bacterium]|nr:6-phosphofructokinase [Acidimicrobiia bacterium]NNL68942.1 6-phosphofructokinase [Acidimicrobiia bacterium]